MGNKDKTQDETATTSSEESRDTALARTIAQAVAEAFAKQKAEETKLITETFTRQMEKTQAQYEELSKASHTQNFPSTLKVTSGSEGFRVMDPFDWTHDKNIYQRWQLWSMKARLALDAMEGDNEKTKISYLHHWLDGKGIDKIKGWMNSKILINQEDYDALEERERIGKYSADKVESYFSLVENILTPRSNPLLAMEELHVTKQGSMTSQDFYSHVLQLVKRCQFPNQEAEERAIREAIFIGMNSQQARDKAINLMNEEGKVVTVEFLMNHLAVEDGNSQHKFLQDLRLKRHLGNFEPKTYRASTTSMTSTNQPKSHEKASKNTNKNTIGTVNIDNLDNVSSNPTPCRTMQPPKTSTFRTMPTPTVSTNQPISDRRPSHSQSGLPPCCMHVLQAKGQVHKSGETPALKKVQQPHNGRTSVSRFPLTK